MNLNWEDRMNKMLGRTLAAALVVTTAGMANALTFSNFVFTPNPGLLGTLGTDYWVNAYATDVDFTFSKAIVGDTLPTRSGTITFTYEATAGRNEAICGVALLGNALAIGNGIVQVSEVLEDQNNLSNTATGGVTITSADSGSFYKMITLAAPATKLKLKKTIFLSAIPDNPQLLDLAAIGLVEQRFTTCVPEPTTMLAVGLGVVGLIARRRRK